jgi:23S rRNA (adenine2030-N6)-methyltransferase
MKHAILLALIAAMRRPVRVVETHAGAGLYDLQGDVARRTGEAEAGVGRLMTSEELPPSLAALKQAVQRENGDGALRLYPGSPALALGAIGAGDGYVGCELRPDDFETFKALLTKRAGKATARAVQADGYEVLGGALKGGDLVLIDPPFERGDDYDRAAEAVGLCMTRKASVAVWTPLKDMETLDGLVRQVEALGPARLSLAEVRLRPLRNPMAMNGCAILLVNAPPIEDEAEAVCRWVAEHCGEAGAKGVVTRLAG